MATRKTKSEERTYTAAELAAAVAAARAAGAAAERDAKKAAREARAAIRDRAGYHDIPTTDRDATYNVLARGAYSVPGVTVVDASACMVEHGGERKTRYSFAPEGCTVFGVPGLTFTDAEEFAHVLGAMLEGLAATVKGLDASYVKRAKGHKFTPPAARKAKGNG